MTLFSKEALFIALIIVVATRVISFFYTIRGKDPSPNVKFALSLLGSVLAVLSAGNTETLTAFGQDLVTLFAAVQTIYNVGKRIWKVLAMALARG